MPFDFDSFIVFHIFQHLSNDYYIDMQTYGQNKVLLKIVLGHDLHINMPWFVHVYVKVKGKVGFKHVSFLSEYAFAKTPTF